MSAEPSMEEILSSIKRIIAEEESGPTRGRRLGRAAPPPVQDPDDDEDDNEVLELSDPVREPEPRAFEPEAVEPPAPAIRSAPVKAEAKSPAEAPRLAPEPLRAAAPEPLRAPAEPIVSHETAAASRGALDSLARLMVKPEPGTDGTLEGLVREMLRPMLREWLDANLPAMVEQMVQGEIARITGQRR